jgi:hypothetical protein
VNGARASDATLDTVDDPGFPFATYYFQSHGKSAIQHFRYLLFIHGGKISLKLKLVNEAGHREKFFPVPGFTGLSKYTNLKV